jgi:hypothetical protein
MSTNKFTKIAIDDKIWRISIYNLLKFPSCIFTQMVNGENLENTEFLYYDKKCFYVDANIESFEIIIDYLRGYNLKFQDLKSLGLINKIRFDAARLGLDLLFKDCTNYLGIYPNDANLKTTNQTNQISTETLTIPKTKLLIKSQVGPLLSSTKDKDKDKENSNQLAIFNTPNTSALANIHKYDPQVEKPEVIDRIESFEKIQNDLEHTDSVSSSPITHTYISQDRQNEPIVQKKIDKNPLSRLATLNHTSTNLLQIQAHALINNQSEIIPQTNQSVQLPNFDYKKFQQTLSSLISADKIKPNISTI